MKDLMGKAILDYQEGNYSEDLVTATHISYNDVLPVPYLFRSYDDMPKIEQHALNLTRGKTLDIGCAAGSHSLYLLNKGLDVTAIDVSPNSIEVCKKRGVKQAFHRNLLDETAQYDTLLSLMNGTGIFHTIELATKYLSHMKSLLKPDGQILIDSSDVSYMYDEEDLAELKQAGIYYGELDYYLSYKGESEEVMTWLYVDFETLKKLCKPIGLNCELVKAGEHFDYLARIISS